MKHDAKCEMAIGTWPSCRCASRMFLQQPGWPECLGRDPRISEARWITTALSILSGNAFEFTT